MLPNRELTKNYLDELAKLVRPRHAAQLGGLLFGLGCLVVLAMVVAGIGGAIYANYRPAPVDWWDAGYYMLSLGSLVAYAEFQRRKEAEGANFHWTNFHWLSGGVCIAAGVGISFALYALAISWDDLNRSTFLRGLSGGVSFAIGHAIAVLLLFGAALIEEGQSEQPRDTLPDVVWEVSLYLDLTPDAESIAAAHAAVRERLGLDYFDLGAVEVRRYVTLAVGSHEEMERLEGQLAFLREQEAIVDLTSLEK